MSENNDQPTTYPAGSVIYINGHQSKKLFILKSGKVRLMKINKDKLHVFQICKPGEILNEISVLTKTPLDHVAVAHNDSVIVTVEVKDINGVIEKCPKWVPEIFKTLCTRLQDSQDIIHEHNLSSGPLDENFILNKQEEQKLLEAIKNFNI